MLVPSSKHLSYYPFLAIHSNGYGSIANNLMNISFQGLICIYMGHPVGWMQNIPQQKIPDREIST